MFVSLCLFLIPLKAEDSYSAVMNYLQSQKSRKTTLNSTQSSDIKTVKSLLIHPAERERILGKAIYSRPVLSNSYISENNHFNIHYDTTGSNAVDNSSTLEPGVPDYVVEVARTAEYSWRILMDTLGFDPPPIDNALSPQTDIYVTNLSGLAYAYTYPENSVSSTPDQPKDYTAYTTIDNDYKESGYLTSGLDGMRVTVAHEFFHVVQLGYNWWDSNGLPGSSGGDQYFLEWSSTWFEERAYPEVDDYIQYLDAFFYRPNKSIWDFDDYAYALGPFIRYLTDVYNDESFIRKVWEKIKHEYALQALMETIESYDGDLVLRYNNYVTACYFTGSRYDARYAVTPDAVDFPLLSISDENFVNNTLIKNSINPLATQCVAIVFSDDQFLDMTIISVDDEDFKTSYVIDKFTTPDFQRHSGSDTEVFIGETRQDDRLLVFITNSSIESKIYPDLILTETEVFPSKILAIYANPYSRMDPNPLHIRLQLGKFINSISYDIYNIRGQQVYRLITDAKDLNPGIIDLEIPADVFRTRNLSSGVYILQLGIDKNRTSYKFTIIN